MWFKNTDGSSHDVYWGIGSAHLLTGRRLGRRNCKIVILEPVCGFEMEPLTSGWRDCGGCESPVRSAWRGGRDVRWVARMLLLLLGRQSEGIIQGD